MGERFTPSPYQRALQSAWAGAGVPRAISVLRITGHFAPGRIQSALATVVARHSALRSHLSDVNGVLCQVMDPVGSVAWDGGSGAVVVAELRALQAGDYELQLTLPATSVDVASFVTIAEELAQFLAGRQLPEDPVQFIEFADWRNELLELQRTTATVRSHVVSTRVGGDYRVHRSARVLEAGLVEALVHTAEELGVELQDCILAAWIGYLTRRTPALVTVVRVALDYRSADAELARLVGPATVYLPLEVECHLDGTFEQLVEAVAVARVELGDQLPETTAEESVPCAGSIGFDVDACPLRVPFRDVGVDLLTADACPEPLTLRLTWSPLTTSLLLRADQEWGSPLALERFLEGLVEFLHALDVQGWRSPLHDLPAVGLQERAWLGEVARGPVAAPHRLLPASIIAVAKRWPERRAVDDGTDRWSFQDLVSRARRVAAAIRPHAGRGKVVGVIAEPSALTVAAILGVMFSGAAYLPIDPALPQRRVKELLEDSGATAVLTSKPQEILQSNRSVINLEGLPTTDDTSIAMLDSCDPAYVMYTSGSSGNPKGVVVTHGGLANYVAFAAATYGIAGDVTAIVSSSFAFDLSVTTLLVPLTAGCATAIGSAHPQGVVEALHRVQGQVVLKITPRYLNALATLLSAEVATRVKTVVVGGEQLDAAYVNRWRQKAPNCRVFNEYGPTETVVGCSVHEIPSGAPVGQGVIPIGVPIVGATLHVLDEQARLVPTETVGELYIGGTGVALGYLGAPGITAERFVPDPFAGGGARLYRTGDRVRRDAEGRLEFIGRADGQLKLRGYRVEPGEVEAALQQHRSVLACAVVQSAQTLVAFVVGSTETIDSAELARHAAELLPDYMVPARFVVVDQLPVTSNGKLDRGALAARRDARSNAGFLTAPQTEMEHFVARVWCAVLKLDCVDIDARFLEMGGDSLMVIEAAAKLQGLTGKPVRPAMFFEHATVRSLAAALSGEARSQAADLGKQRAGRRVRQAAQRRKARR